MPVTAKLFTEEGDGVNEVWFRLTKKYSDSVIFETVPREKKETDEVIEQLYNEYNIPLSDLPIIIIEKEDGGKELQRFVGGIHLEKFDEIVSEET